ncbi:unnamed protein product [Meganyctiphanes norvegica]|uniref:Uncharacterized protein n=1 Tax=Meganyctiphanes norvegica TaxID=48144 RepID=A0AAV2QS64_MEGNR
MKTGISGLGYLDSWSLWQYYSSVKPSNFSMYRPNAKVSRTPPQVKGSEGQAQRFTARRRQPLNRPASPTALQVLQGQPSAHPEHRSPPVAPLHTGNANTLKYFKILQVPYNLVELHC